MKIDRNDVPAWYSPGILEGGRVGTEHFSEAGYFIKALKINPNFAKACYHLGVLGGGRVSTVAVLKLWRSIQALRRRAIIQIINMLNGQGWAEVSLLQMLLKTVTPSKLPCVSWAKLSLLQMLLETVAPSKLLYPGLRKAVVAADAIETVLRRS